MRVSILTNGPGELWGWARPVIMELRKRGHSVSLWILPCQFASGREREVASLLGVDKLEGPASAARIWKDMYEEKTDRIIQLGGDIAFGIHISRTAQAPLTCYTYGTGKKLKGVRLLTAFEAQAGKMHDATAIGDLVKDALLLDNKQRDFQSWDWPEKKGSPRVIFLPGNRPLIRKFALEWLIDVKRKLTEKIPELRVRSLFSQFMPEDEFSKWRQAGLNPFRSEAGVAMQNSDYALTQPGTNNFELMHCGLPALVVGPEKFLQFVPVSGILGTLTSVPLLGKSLKRMAVLRIIKRWGGTIALPNRIADHKVMDEVYGNVTPEDVALRIAESLSDSEKLIRTRTELLKLSGPSGAASRLCDLVLMK